MTGPRHDQSDSRAEEEVGTSQAPLMKLLNNHVFGTTSSSAASTPNSFPCQDRAADPGPLRSRPHKGLVKDREVLRDLCLYMPSETVMTDILDNDSSWWPLYRETLGFYWGGDLPDLRSFATQALSDGHPPSVALLLVCFAIGTGELERYLPPVEKHILHDDDYAATEYGLNCLMALGLCYMSSLQPRRAWTVYRRANTLLQLNGIHLQHRSDRHELLFWQLFHADRWVSLMIGMPYMVPNHFCDLTIAPIGVLGAGTWMYRQLGVLTAGVLECIQDVNGPTLSAALEVEEQLEHMRSQLPPGYLDLAMIRVTTDTTDKFTRLYRIVHYHLLKLIIHLPFLLRSANESRFEYSRKSCIDDSRQLLEAFLEVYDSDATMVCYGTVISFTALMAVIVVVLGLFGYGAPRRPDYVPSPEQQTRDWKMILRVREAIKYGSNSKVAGLLCTRCHTALDEMIKCAQDPIHECKRIVLPYFGTLNFVKRTSPPQSTFTLPVSLPPQTPMPDWMLGQSDIAMTYDGPYMPENDATSWMLGLESDLMPDAGVNQSNCNQSDGTDWSWLFADLPPNSGL